MNLSKENCSERLTADAARTENLEHFQICIDTQKYPMHSDAKKEVKSLIQINEKNKSFVFLKIVKRYEKKCIKKKYWVRSQFQKRER